MNPGKTAIVTGASSGIGLEFSRQLAYAGWDLIMVSNQEKELEEAAEMLGSTGIEAVPVFLDLSDENAADFLMEKTKELGVVPALLINNAGIFDFRLTEELSEKRIDLYINLHIRTVTKLCLKFAGLMSSHDVKGHILNMSSMSCWMPMPGIAMYSATKAYIRVLTRALSVELADKGVSLTVACPGGIATDLFGLGKNLQKLGVRLGVLATPQKFVRKALAKTFQRRRQYINGMLNRISIVAVASTPFFVRKMIKTHLLDKKKS